MKIDYGITDVIHFSISRNKGMKQKRYLTTVDSLQILWKLIYVDVLVIQDKERVVVVDCVSSNWRAISYQQCPPMHQNGLVPLFILIRRLHVVLNLRKHASNLRQNQHVIFNRLSMSTPNFDEHEIFLIRRVLIVKFFSC
jgi:hypothetical protein